MLQYLELKRYVLRRKHVQEYTCNISYQDVVEVLILQITKPKISNVWRYDLFWKLPFIETFSKKIALPSLLDW